MGGGLALATEPSENHAEQLLLEQVLYRVMHTKRKRREEKRRRRIGGKSSRVYSKLRSKRSGTKDSELQP